MKGKSILYSTLLAAYLSYLMLLIKIADTEVNQAVVTFGLLPLGVPLFFLFLSRPGFRRIFFKTAGVVIVFYFCYCVVSTYNIKAVFRGLSYFAAYTLHILITIWFLRKKEFLNINVHILTMLMLAVFVVFIPHYLITGSLKLGSFYNLTSPRLLTDTTLEAPLISSLLFLLSMSNVIVNKKYNLLSIFSSVFAVFLLLLFSRRGLIFSSFISISVYYFYIKSGRKILLYASLSLLVLPMFWDMISTLLFDLSNNSLFSAIIVRNNSDEIKTATGRAICWLNVLTLFFTFKTAYIFGFKGGPPEDVFLTTGENHRYENAHNAFLNLFLEAGYFIDVLFVILLVMTFYRYAKLKKFNSNYYVLILMFLISLSASESIVRGIQFSSFILCFFLVGCNISTENSAQLIQYAIRKKWLDNQEFDTGSSELRKV